MNHCPIYDAISPIARIHRSGNQGMEIEVVSHTTTPRNPLSKFLLPVPANLHSVGIEVLVNRGKNDSTKNTTITLN